MKEESLAFRKKKTSSGNSTVNTLCHNFRLKMKTLLTWIDENYKSEGNQQFSFKTEPMREFKDITLVRNVMHNEY